MTYEIAKVTQRTCIPERELAGDAVDGDDKPESEHLLREKWTIMVLLKYINKTTLIVFNTNICVIHVNNDTCFWC